MQIAFKHIQEDQMFVCESCGDTILERVCANAAAPVNFGGHFITFDQDELVTVVSIH